MTEGTLARRGSAAWLALCSLAFTLTACGDCAGGDPDAAGSDGTVSHADAGTDDGLSPRDASTAGDGTVADAAGDAAFDAAATDATDGAAGNRAPVAALDFYPSQQESTLTVDAASGVLDNDSDPDGDALVAMLATPPAHGTLALAVDGSFVYVPASGFSGADAFSYRASDGQLLSSPALVSVYISATGNAAPTVVDDSIELDEDTPTVISVLGNDTEPDGDPLTVLILDGPSRGSATTDGTTIEFTPARDDSGTDAITYGVTDGRGGFGSARVLLTIVEVNDLPIATPVGPVTLREDESAALVLTGTDVETPENLLLIDVTQRPQAGTIDPASGLAPLTVTYTPLADFFGTDAFTFTVLDTAAAAAAPVTVEFVVTPVNDAPVAGDDIAYVEPDVASRLAVLANDSDADADPLTVSGVAQPSHGIVDTDGTEVTYTPAAGYVGSDSFSYTIEDALGVAASATVSVSVATEVWTGRGGSDFGPASTFLTWGSASGAGISNARAVLQVEVAVDSRDQPAVAWSDGEEIFLRHYDGSTRTWEELAGSGTGGGISNNRTSSSGPRLAIDGSDRPLVVWQNLESSYGDYEIYVRRWNTGSATWDELGAGSAVGGGISGGSSNSNWPALALKASGDPVVTWQEYVTNKLQIYLKHFDGAAWLELGTGSASGTGISNVTTYAGGVFESSVTLDAAGNPVVAWIKSVYDGVHVVRWDPNSRIWRPFGSGATWEYGISGSYGDANAPRLATDGSGNPVIVWYRSVDLTREVVARRWNAGLGDWDPGVVISAPSTSATAPALAIHDTEPVVTWSDARSGNREIYLRRWNTSSGSWDEIEGSASGGGVSASHGGAGHSAVAIDSAGVPIVAWIDGTSGGDQVYVRRWNAVALRWDEIGTPGAAAGGALSNSAAGANNAVVAIDHGGAPIAAWANPTASGSQIHLRRWNAGSARWDELGAGSATAGGISNAPAGARDPALAIGPDGQPIVAWSTDGPQSSIQLRRWNPDLGTWVELGTSASGTGVSGSSPGAMQPALAIAPNGSPVVAWSTGSQIYLRRWSPGSASWDPIGASATGGGVSDTPGASTTPALALDAAGVPAVAWADTSRGNGDVEIYFKRYDPGAGNWQELAASATHGGVSNNESSNSDLSRDFQPALVIDPSGNPIIAWHGKQSGYPGIFVRRWDGLAWQPLGTSIHTNGIATGSSGTGSSSLALDSQGRPVVAWQDSTSGNFEIYLRRWNPAAGAWDEVVAGSATGHGISNSGAPSLSPSLAVSAGGLICVAWHESGTTATEIVLRCNH